MITIFKSGTKISFCEQNVTYDDDYPAYYISSIESVKELAFPQFETISGDFLCYGDIHKSLPWNIIEMMRILVINQFISRL